jgi:hypothetical protein
VLYWFSLLWRIEDSGPIAAYLLGRADVAVPITEIYFLIKALTCPRVKNNDGL